MLSQSLKEEEQISNQIEQLPTNKHSIFLSQFYQEYRQIIGPSKACKTSEIISNFSKHKITYNQLRYDRPFRYYVEFFQNLHQFFKLKVQWRCFDLELLIAETQINNPLRQCQSSKGNFGEVFFTEFLLQQIAVKSFKFSSQEQLQHKLPFVIRQWSIFKICSVLECAPCLDSHFGFDLVIYNDCIQYASEAGEMKYDGLSKKDKLQVFGMLDLMHYFKIIHGDIKPENFIYSHGRKKYVFIDFGFSEIIKQEIGLKTFTTFRGTPQFCTNQMTKILLNPPDYIDLYYNDVIGLTKLFYVLQNLGYKQIVLKYRNYPWTMELVYKWVFMKFRHDYLIGDLNNARNIIFYFEEFLELYIDRILGFIKNSMSVFFSISLFFEDLKPFKTLQQYKQIQKKIKQDLFGLFNKPFSQETQSIFIQSKIRNIFASQQHRYSTGNLHNYMKYSSLILNQIDKSMYDDEKILQLAFECIRFDTLNVNFQCKVKIAEKINRTIFITYQNQRDIELQGQKQMKDIRMCLSSMIYYCMKPPLTWWKKQTILQIFYQSIITDSYLSIFLDQFLSFLFDNYLQIQQKVLSIIYIRRFLQLIKHKQRFNHIQYIITCFQKMINYIQIQIKHFEAIFKQKHDQRQLIPIQALICLNQQFSNNIQYPFISRAIQSISSKSLQNNLLFLSINRQIDDKCASGNFQETYQLFYAFNRNSNFKRISLHQYIHMNIRVLIGLSKDAELRDFKKKMEEIIGCSIVSRNCDFMFQRILDSPGFAEKAVQVISQNFTIFSSIINIDLFLFSTILYFKQFHVNFTDSTRKYLLDLFQRVQPFKISAKCNYPHYNYHCLYYRIIVQYCFYGINQGQIDWPLGLSQHHYQVDEESYSRFRGILLGYYGFKIKRNTSQATKSIKELMDFCNEKNLTVLKFDIINQLIDHTNQDYEGLRMIYEQCKRDNYFFPYFRPEILKYTFRTIIVFMEESIEIGYQFLSDILNFMESHQYISYIALFIRIMNEMLQQQRLRGKFAFDKVKLFFEQQLKSNSYIIALLLLCINQDQQMQNISIILQLLAYHFDYVNSLFRNCIIYDYYSIYISATVNKPRKKKFVLIRLAKRFAPQSKLKKIFRKHLKQANNSYEMNIKKGLLKFIQYNLQNYNQNDSKNPSIQ